MFEEITVTVMRNDLGMSVGKMIAQGCHSVKKKNTPHIVLFAETEKQLLELASKLKNAKLVVDAGKTELPPSTPTCFSVTGERKYLNKYFKKLTSVY